MKPFPLILLCLVLAFGASAQVDDAVYLELHGYLQNHQDEKAMQLLNEMITQDPTDPVLWYTRGSLLQEHGDSNCVADYRKVLALKPGHFDALYGLGSYYYKQWFDGHTDQATIDNALLYLNEAHALRIDDLNVNDRLRILNAESGK